MNEFPLVTPLEERESDSVPGPFYVTKQCITCGLPPETAPNNISWDENWKRSGCTGCVHHCRVEKQPETEEELKRMIEAAISSCVEAIRYCGTDPKILAKFKELKAERLCDALSQRPWREMINQKHILYLIVAVVLFLPVGLEIAYPNGLWKFVNLITTVGLLLYLFRKKSK